MTATQPLLQKRSSMTELAFSGSEYWCATEMKGIVFFPSMPLQAGRKKSKYQRRENCSRMKMLHRQSESNTDSDGLEGKGYSKRDSSVCCREWTWYFC
jgi:hypothetical protein